MAASYYLSFILLLLPLLLLKLKSTSGSKSKLRLPPGPSTLPIIGSIHHLVGRGLPHQALHDLSKQYGHLMYLHLGELRALVVSSKEAAREVLKTHDLNFCTRPLNPTAKIMSFDGKDVAFAPYGEHWREMRKICVLELLSAKRVQSFRSIREKEIGNMVQSIRALSSAGQSFNLSEKLFVYTNDVTLQAIMGRKTAEQELFLREIRNGLEVVTDFGIANLFPSSRLIRMLTGAVRRAEQFRNSMDHIFLNILKEQSEAEVNKGDAENLLRVILRLHAEDSENNVVTHESIKGVILDTFGAGTETTATTLNWVMSELMRNPRVMKKVQTELRQHLQGHGQDIVTESELSGLRYIHLIIKEAMRLHPPLPMLVPRECRETCNILSYDIPKGTLVLINAYALGRDSNNWKDAEEFKPERFEEDHPDVTFNGVDFEFIPFGAGRRMCPGITFGLASIELVLANLLYHFDWELPNGTKPHELDMTEETGIASRRKSPLCLRAMPH